MPTASRASSIYLLVYTFMNLGAFAVITSLRHRDVIGDEIDDIERPLLPRPGRSRADADLPAVAGRNSAAGRILGKYFIFLSLIETGHYVLASSACCIPSSASTTT